MHIKHILRGFLKQVKGQADTRDKVKALMASLLTAKMKTHVKVSGIYKGKLTLSTDTQTASYELNLKKAALLAAVKKEFPEVNEIKIKAE